MAVRPVTLLLFLSVLASLGGGWAYAVYERKIYEQQIAELKAATTGSATEGEKPQDKSGDVTLLKTNLEYFKKQVELLKKENESLSAAVKKLSEASPAENATAATAEPGAPSAPATTPEALVREIELIRELKFNPAPVFVPVPVTELERRIREAIEANLSREDAAAHVRAARALGWVDQDFDLIDALTGLTLEQSGGFFDLNTNELLYDESADFAGRPDLKGRLITEIAAALVRQQHRHLNLTGIGPRLDDSAHAVRALLLGDAVATKIHQGVLEALNSSASAPPPTPAAMVGLANAPVYLREFFIFPYMLGSQFAQELSSEAGPKALDAVYSRLPLSTAEILHPQLYQNTPPFTPQPVPWPDPEVAGQKPMHDFAVGEFGLYILLKRQVEEEQAYRAAEGWAGDRCLVFAGTEEAGDHLFAQFFWQTEKDAREFIEAAQTFYLGRYSIPWKKQFEQPDGSFVVNDPGRIIRLRLSDDKKAVTLLLATDEAFANALEEKFAAR